MFSKRCQALNKIPFVTRPPISLSVSSPGAKRQSQPSTRQWRHSWISFPKNFIMNKSLSLCLELTSPGESLNDPFPGENTALLGASVPQRMFELGSNSRVLSAAQGFLWLLLLSSLFNRSVVSDSLRPHALQHDQASMSFTTSQSLLKLMSIKSVMPPNHLILCRPLLLLPSIFPSFSVFKGL